MSEREIAVICTSKKLLQTGDVRAAMGCCYSLFSPSQQGKQGEGRAAQPTWHRPCPGDSGEHCRRTTSSGEWQEEEETNPAYSAAVEHHVHTATSRDATSYGTVHPGKANPTAGCCNPKASFLTEALGTRWTRSGHHTALFGLEEPAVSNATLSLPEMPKGLQDSI